MKESEIRLNDNREYRPSLYRGDQQRLLQKLDHFVVIDCPACAGKDNTLFYERDGFTFEICSSCETVFVNPRPTMAMLFEHYRDSESEKYWNEIIYPKTEKGRIEHLIKPRLNKIYRLCEEFNVEFDTLLDIGAGYGTLCEIALNDGKFKRVIAVEPNPSPANICRGKNIEVIERFLETIEEEDLADVVTSIENIEHVFSPELFLNKISRILKKGGLLVISTPNIKGFDLLILKDKSDNTTAPDHLNYFHPDSISILLLDNGFELLKLATPGKLDVELVRKKHLEGAICINNPFLRRIVIDEHEKYGGVFQKWLAEQGLSSHMLIVARKK